MKPMSKPCRMVLGLVEIASGLAKILTLGWYAPPWSLNFCRWDMTRRTAQVIANGAWAGRL